MEYEIDGDGMVLSQLRFVYFKDLSRRYMPSYIPGLGM